MQIKLELLINDFSEDFYKHNGRQVPSCTLHLELKSYLP